MYACLLLYTQQRTYTEHTLPGMNAVLKKQVLNKIHKYTTPKLDTLLSAKCISLDDDVFKAKVKNESLPFGVVSGYKQTPDWYSPGASSWCTAVADLYMIRDCINLGDMKYIDYAWKAGIMKAEHRLVFNWKGKRQWKYIALGGFSNSATFTWPVTVTKFPRSEVSMFRAETIAEPKLQLLYDLDLLECWSYRFYSYQGLYEAYPAIRSYLKPGVSASNSYHHHHHQYQSPSPPSPSTTQSSFIIIITTTIIIH